MARAPASAPMSADMAMDPNAAPMDMPPEDMAQEDMAAEDMEPEAQGQVLCTVILNTDGSLTLMEGDEPEEMHGGEEMGEGEGMAAEQVPSQTFDSVGPLLKAILDMVQTAQDGGETGSDQMRAGYAGDEAAAPPSGM